MNRNIRAEPNPAIVRNVVRMRDYERRRRPAAPARRPDDHCIVTILPPLPLRRKKA